jgi:OmcA/MtrC family decaheme c-type cytochrome
MTFTAMLGKLGRLMLMGLALAIPAHLAQAQAWDAVKYFQYNIENVTVTPAGPGSWTVRVIFSVSNPALGGTWNIRNDLPFTSAGASLTLDIGWDAASDFTNTGSANASLLPLVGTALGSGAAIPVRVGGLQGATGGAAACDPDPLQCPGVASTTNRFWVQKTVTPVPFTAAVKFGRVALEGKPVCNGIAGFTCPTAAAPFAAVPVTSATASFAFTATQSLAAIVANPRRAIVDINKCHQCHDGKQHGNVVVPKLSLHGNNRTENLGLCVVCHNPNQTDVPYRYETTGTTADPRIAGKETPIDFKVLVHSIHAGGFRETPYVVVGFGSSVNDFSDVRFPRELRNCVNCHIDANGKGTFELPIKATLGTTVNTQSNYLVPPGATRSINVNPNDDLRMTPTAATCSACHDNAEVRSHMVRTGGASFATLQANIGTTIVERCANCHGPGKDRDVRKVHEIGGSHD